MADQKYVLHTHTGDILYSVERSRRRTLSIIIRRDGKVAAKVPLRTSDADVASFVKSKERWISKHVERITGSYDRQKMNYTNGEVHTFLGMPVTLMIRETGKNAAYLSEGVINIECKGSWDPLKGEVVLNTLYKKLALKIFSERLTFFLEKFSAYNFKPAALKVRTTISRWGSCSAKGSITLSTNLIKKRVDLIDYVILHELCHLRHRNHGPNFYKLLEEICPDYREIRKELRENM